MNAGSFISFFIYLRYLELIVAFKMAPSIKKHSYISRVKDPYIDDTPVYNARFATSADIMSYTCICKFETKWNQILDASLITFTKLLAGKSSYNPVAIPVNIHVCDVINFTVKVTLINLLLM